MENESQNESAGQVMDKPDVGEDSLFDLNVFEQRRSADEQENVEPFLRFFGGRRDLYARAWHDQSRRRGGYRPVREPLTPEVAKRHLEGGITVGQYVLFPDDTVSFGAIDLDLNADEMARLETIDGESPAPTASEPLRDFTQRLTDAAKSFAVQLFPEDSGGKGIHLWAFFEPRAPASSVRQVLSTVLKRAGSCPAVMSVEVFPKQVRAGQKGLSSLIKLPLGLHRRTMRRCDLLDDQLQVLPAAAALKRLATVPAEVVGDIVGNRLLPLPAVELAPREPPLALPTAPTSRCLAQALRAIKAGEPTKAACDRVIRGCAVLGRVVARAYGGKKLEPLEWRALIYTVGLIGEENRVAEDALRAARASTSLLQKVRCGTPNPMGCRKLQNLGVKRDFENCCPCSKRPAGPTYATPALFAVEVEPATPAWQVLGGLGGNGDDEALEMQDPFAEVAERLSGYEERLKRLEGNAKAALNAPPTPDPQPNDKSDDEQAD